MRNKLTVILYASFKMFYLGLKGVLVGNSNTLKRVELDEEYERLEVLIDNTFQK